MIFKDWFTESDNETHDLAKVLAAMAVVSGIAMAGMSVYQGKPFSMQDYGIGVGALFMGVGACFGLKKETPK